MVNDGVKKIFRQTFCCSQPKLSDETCTAVPVTVPKNGDKTNDEKRPVSRDYTRRASAFSYRSCASSIGTARSLSCSSLQSVMSKNTANFDYYSIYSSNTPGRASFNSCAS